MQAEDDFIVIDVGSTRTKVAAFLNGVIDGKITFLTKDISHRLKGSFETVNKGGITKIGFCSVVPEATLASFPYLVSDRAHSLEVNAGMKMPFKSRYRPIATLGNDRIALTTFAYRYMAKSGKNMVAIVSAGTATTIDVITKEKGHLGGVILSGATTSFYSLLERTKSLPDVVFEKTPPILGHSTVGALQSGWYWGFVEQVFGVLQRLEKFLSAELLVIVSGGNGYILKEAALHQCILEEDAVLKGVKDLMVYHGVFSGGKSERDA